MRHVGPIKGRSFVSMKFLTEFIKDEVKSKPIGDNTLVDRVKKIARLYMLVILRGILFPNSSGNVIRLHFLEFLHPIGVVGSYSWGSTISAYLYKSLYGASYENTIVLYGFLSLIQVINSVLL